jgi:ketosteroid isomerase-like protein
MGYLIGTYEATLQDGTKDKGKYCEVWKKQTDGKWKVSADMFSSDLPVSGASSPATGDTTQKK